MSKLVAGDKVVIIKNLTGHEFPIGTICMFGFDEEGDTMVFTSDDCWWVNKEEVLLIESREERHG